MIKLKGGKIEARQLEPVKYNGVSVVRFELIMLLQPI